MKIVTEDGQFNIPCLKQTNSSKTMYNLTYIHVFTSIYLLTEWCLSNITEIKVFQRIDFQ